jgi:hypothetical protein
VKAGTVLIRLDPRDHQVALDRAEAELADAEATARAARVGVPIASTTTTSELRNTEAAEVAARQEVDMANARLAEADANCTKAAADLQRYSQLVEKNEVPRQQYDSAVATDKAARATLDAARAAVANAQTHVRQAEERVRSAETGPQQVAVTRSRAGAAAAMVQRAGAAVEQARLNLEVEAIEKVVQDHAVGVERRTRIEPFRFAPRDKTLDVIRRDHSYVRLGCNVLGKQVQNVVVLLRRHGLAEGADVFDEFGNCGVERHGRFGLGGFFDLEATRARGELEAFLLLCLDRFCRRDPPPPGAVFSRLLATR